MTGKLYIVATPIGHLDDWSQRAIETMKSVDGILAEDTRHTQKLLSHYQIKQPSISLHQHNETERLDAILADLAADKQLALVSDAGTPTINDPGYRIVAAVKAAGFTVIPIPGPCAVIAALSASGILGSPFSFLGFVPTKNQSRSEFFQAVKDSAVTTIFFEAPHRVQNCIDALAQNLEHDRIVCMAKEISKVFETIITGTCADIQAYFEKDPKHVQGEFVLIVSPNEHPADEKHIAVSLDGLLQCLMREMPLKKAVSLATELTDIKRNVIYDRALKLKG